MAPISLEAPAFSILHDGFETILVLEIHSGIVLALAPLVQKHLYFRNNNWPHDILLVTLIKHEKYSMS